MVRRRRREEGEIIKRGNSWMIRFSKTDPITGQRIKRETITITKLIPKDLPENERMKLAEKELIRLRHERAQGRYQPPSKMTIGELTIKRDIAIIAKLKGKSRDSYRSITRKHIVPVFGNTKVSKLSADSIRAYLDRCIESGLNAKTVHNIRQEFVRLLDFAIEEGVININVARRIKSPWSPKLQRPTMCILPPKKMRDLIEYFKDSPYYAPIATAFYTGARLGELCALKWGDLVLEEGCGSVSISKSIQETSGGVLVGYPKTSASQRLIDIDDDLVYILLTYRMEKQARMIAAKMEPNTDYDDYIFSDPDGRPFRPSRLSKAFKKIARTSGVPEMRFHDLRHNHASYLIRAGVDIRRVAARLGHSTPTTTLNIYAHLIPSSGRDVVERLSDYLKSSYE